MLLLTSCTAFPRRVYITVESIVATEVDTSVKHWSVYIAGVVIEQLYICTIVGKSSESVQCAMLNACDACADMGQL